MFDLSSLNSARNKANKNKVQNEDKFDKTLNEAIDLYNTFMKTENDETLKQSAEKFGNAISLKKTRVEPYIGLASIFQVFGQTQKALEYLEAAKELSEDNKDFLKFIYQLKKAILKNAKG